MKKIISLLIFIFIISNLVNSQETKITIFFANGMFTSYKKATITIWEIEKRVKSEISDDINIRFKVAYNHNEDPLTQIAQVAEQEGFSNWTLLANPMISVPLLPAFIKNEINKIQIEANGNTYVIDKDLESHIRAYRAELNEGRRVIVVAQSQGNFYANQAYAILSEEDFYIVSVGNPDNYVGGNGRYVTLTNDVIVNAVRSIVDPYTLAGNETNSQNYEWSNHNFIETYLVGDKTEPRIIKNIVEVCETTTKLYWIAGEWAGTWENFTLGINGNATLTIESITPTSFSGAFLEEWNGGDYEAEITGTLNGNHVSGLFYHPWNDKTFYVTGNITGTYLELYFTSSNGETGKIILTKNPLN